jgi:hypothetical protein
MKLNEIRTSPTTLLVNRLTEYADKGDQQAVNIVAYELAYRIYCPFNGQKTFEDVLTSLGYKQIEKDKPKIKEIGSK